MAVTDTTDRDDEDAPIGARLRAAVERNEPRLRARQERGENDRRMARGQPPIAPSFDRNLSSDEHAFLRRYGRDAFAPRPR